MLTYSRGLTQENLSNNPHSMYNASNNKSFNNKTHNEQDSIIIDTSQVSASWTTSVFVKYIKQ